MLIPADFLSGALLPWILAMPALPLAVILFRRASFTPVNIALLVVCIVTMMTNFFFNLVFKTPEQIDNDTYLMGVMVEFAASMLLLMLSTEGRLIRGLVIGTAAMFLVALLATLMIGSDQVHLGVLLGIGYLIIAAFALVVLQKTAEESPTVFLTSQPTFWIASGLIIHFGLFAWLLFTHPGTEPAEWMRDDGFIWIFAVSNMLRFILFSASILAGMAGDVVDGAAVRTA